MLVLTGLGLSVAGVLIVVATHRQSQPRQLLTTQSHEFGDERRSSAPSGVSPAHADTIPANTKVPSVRSRLADDPQAMSRAALALKLWEPQLPADVARGFGGSAPTLIDALTAWQRSIEEGRGTFASAVQIESALKVSKLTPEQCVQMTNVLAGWEDVSSDGKEVEYHEGSRLFARQAIYSAAEVLRSHPSADRDQIARSVAPIVRRTWYGDVNDAAAVQVYYTLLSNGRDRDADREYYRSRFGQIEALGRQGQRRVALEMLWKLERGQAGGVAQQKSDAAFNEDHLLAPGGLHEDPNQGFGLAKCLYYLGKSREAIEVIDQVAPSLRGEEQTDAQFMHAMAQINVQRLPEAIRELQAIVERNNPTYFKDALALLLETSILKGDATIARTALTLWKTRIGLSTFAEADFTRRIALIDSRLGEGGNDRSQNAPPVDQPNRIAVLDPRDCIGKPLANLQDIEMDGPDTLTQGHFLLIFFHHDCQQCRTGVPDYIAAAHRMRAAGNFIRVAFIEIPPYAPKHNPLVPPNDDYLVGRLPQTTEWFVPMLSRAEILDGIVVRAWAYASDKTDLIPNQLTKG